MAGRAPERPGASGKKRSTGVHPPPTRARVKVKGGKDKLPYTHNKPSRVAEKKMGYECEFVEPLPKQFQSECPICLQILHEPRLIDCCGYNFCATCIERVGRDGKPCPLCNKPGFTTMANKGLKRLLHELHVYCPHRLHGCEWIGELGMMDRHVNSDPKPQGGSQFAMIECLHCKESIRQDKISGHQLERCPQRPYTCQYCTVYKSTFEDVVHSHWPKCKCFLLSCPKECTPPGITHPTPAFRPAHGRMPSDSSAVQVPSHWL